MRKELLDALERLALNKSVVKKITWVAHPSDDNRIYYEDDDEVHVIISNIDYALIKNFIEEETK
jgi:hypothetical protein